MRYLDWDVLLFPDNVSTPFKEFKTTCFAVKTSADRFEKGTIINGEVTPLLTTFVPNLPQGSSFKISIHAWLGTKHKEMFDGDTPYKRHVLQVRVLIDGLCVTTQTYPAKCGWPQVISNNNPDNYAGHACPNPLRFPAFPKSKSHEREWDAASDEGRIKIEINPGYEYLDQQYGTLFENFGTAIFFSFYPAPIDLLEKVGIAWPSKLVFANPLHAIAQDTSRTSPAVFHSVSDAHRRSVSHGDTNISPPLHCLPQSSSGALLHGYRSFASLQNDTTSNYDMSSRSTSSYSNLDFPARPDSLSLGLVDQFLTRPHAHDLAPLQLLTPACSTMPPPPLPAHAIAARKTQSEHRGQYGPIDQCLTTLTSSDCSIDRRAERSSDVSMHAGCTEFPTCMTENEVGQMVHSSPAAPSTVVRGKKEGSSPTRPRDFMSTILSPTSPAPGETSVKEPIAMGASPAESTGRKRTRSAFKELALNSGSPEKKEVPKKQPARKASRTSVGSDMSSSSKKSKIKRQEVLEFDPNEDKENMMVMDV